MDKQTEFDLTIGRLDNVLSRLVIWGKDSTMDLPNKQTLKHHAEDMIAAGNEILSDLKMNKAYEKYDPSVEG